MLTPEQTQEVGNYVRNLEIERDDAIDNASTATRNVNSIFQSPENENIIQWQLDLQEQLENIGHSLRGHVISTDKDGNPTWKEPQKKEDIIFTEYGVQEILRFLLQYLNKNTILSNYSEEIINYKVHDAGLVLVDLIFNRYEKFFYVSSKEELLKEDPDLSEYEIKKIQHDERREKMKHFESSVRPVIDAIHSSYLRALNGGERESLRSARILTQTQNPDMNRMGMGMISTSPQTKRSLLKPSTWF